MMRKERKSVGAQRKGKNAGLERGNGHMLI